MSAEIGRLLLLKDQQGLKMRFEQVYRERDMVIEHALQQLKAKQPLEFQKAALEKLLFEYRETLVLNKTKTQSYLEQVDADLRVVETELVDELKQAQQLTEQQSESVARAEEGLQKAVLGRQKADN